MESLDRVISFQLLELNGSVLIKELVNRKIPTSNTNLDLIFLDLDCDSLGSELVNTLRLTHEHDLQFTALRIVVDILSQFLVSDVILDWNVDGNPLLQVNNVLLESGNLNLGFLQLLENFKRNLIGFVDLLLHLQVLLNRQLQLFSKIGPNNNRLVELGPQSTILLSEHSVFLFSGQKPLVRLLVEFFR